jgi:hypothetical protein
MKTGSMYLYVLSITFLAGEAQARSRSDREGLNFGTSVRLMDSDNRSNATSTDSPTARNQSAGQAFSPYLGYSFGEINLGLAGTAENRRDVTSETTASTNQQVTRESQTTTKSLSIFARFNFGKVMFMEVGAGAYNQVTDVHNEYKLIGDAGSFNGKSEDYKVEGIGPGYHVGGGLELPINNGFYFSGAYMVRSFALRDTKKSQFGDPIGSQQKKELSFGIAYYN